MGLIVVQNHSFNLLKKSSIDILAISVSLWLFNISIFNSLLSNGFSCFSSKYRSITSLSIIVLVIGNFKSHYNDALKHNALLKKYKNAEITYLIPNKIPFNLILN